jgi:very-short-patch-repair endonuclease
LALGSNKDHFRELAMSDLHDRVLEMIKVKPGQKAKDIAAQLGVDRQLVNSALYGRLKGKVQQDKSYRWYVKGSSGIDRREDQGPKRLDTPLARLCCYYLDCLSHDDLGGVSEFASSKYGQPSYVELTALPIFDQGSSDPFDSDGGRQLLGRVRRDRNRQAIFLGYPVRLNLIRSRKTSWEGFKVEPLLLFPFQDVNNQYGKPSLGDDLPQINLQALRSLSNTGETSLMEEAIQLAEELGFGNAAGDHPDLDELLSRMREIRSDWDWQENLDPYILSSGAPLANLNQQGIYNRAILVSAERSPYTRGLESELGMLQSVEEGKYHGTALGAWLTRKTIDSPPADQQPLLEVLPLNSEQRQAVRQALSNPLTVITGPPGTGKSQVVTSILVNAAWQGKTVLFASKNNKAVDVVETRVNAMGPRPVLLRLGANEYQTRLADYLVSLLAATATADDHARYRECEAIHGRLQQRFDALDAQFQAIVQLRNEVDALEQRVEQVRHDMGEDVFRRARLTDRENFARAAAHVRGAIDHANKAKQGILTRLVWPFVRGRRFKRLAMKVEPFRNASQQLGSPLPEGAVDSLTISEWVQYGHRLAKRVSQVTEAQEYFGKLASLTQARSIEELSRLRKGLTDELSVNSEALWQAWLRLQPARMSPEQRKLLGDYSALLQMIVSANDQNRQLGRDAFRRYYQLFPQITSILSCWAVTSLSARGRVPFEPNFFDLLVVDEASQCDIASALPLLFRARRAVVIGDPMQLRHISTLSKQQDQQLLGKHGLVDEYPGWAYSPRSLFDLASSLCRSEDIVALRDHHRSHADIIEFSNETFYEGRLRVATRYDRLRRPRQDEPAVRWVHVQGKTVRPGMGGAVNEKEASRVVVEIERLLSQGYRGSIGVVSPFRAQANRIRDLVYQHDGLSSRIADVDFLADTVHKFQGDERDVMIFSPVVSVGVADSALGFLRSNSNLFNVAITRARAALIVVGDRATALNCSVDYLSRFAAYVDRVGDMCQPSKTEANAEHGPEYPPVSQPERVSEWERLFYRAIYAAGIRPIPQYPVEKYALDFAVVTGDRRLNIEIDGERYHRNWDGELCRRDQIRNQRLMELGWDVMRFWVYQVRDDLDCCVSLVKQWIERR